MENYIDRELIEVALGDKPADMIIEGGELINVNTRKVYPADVAIAKGRIATIGDVRATKGESTEVINAKGQYLAPGLIDTHIHPEVTKLTLTQFANAVLPKGTTSIMCALDQMGVVVGIQGMRFVLDEIKKTPLKVFHSSPSRLPYTTPASNIAYDFGPEEHEISQKWPEAVGIWEYMADSILDHDKPVYEVAEMALQNGLGLHGHCPLTTGKELSACVAAGMRNDHEAYTAEELLEKLEKGLFGFIRRGTHSDNVPACIKAITEFMADTRHIALCTDDLDCLDLLELGHMDFLIRYVISMGVDPITAIQMTTINAAESYRVDHLVGSITPGRIADVLLVDDLRLFNINSVIANGNVVAESGNMVEPLKSPSYPAEFMDTVRLNQKVGVDDIYLSAKEDASYAKILCMHLDTTEGLLNRRRDAEVKVDSGRLLPDPKNDVCYISVTERHSGNGKTSSAFISGFGLKEGAIATSLSPDDDNIICVGASVEDMVVAINHLASIGGGQVVVNNNKVQAEIKLPICGLMADVPYEEMAEAEKELNHAAAKIGSKLSRPFFFIIFLSITAIPDYAMTDKGLVEHASRSVISPIIELE